MPEKLILLTGAEIQSNFNRQQWAERLIEQLPEYHEGRNSWLLNFGTREQAAAIREKLGLKFNETFKACETNRSPDVKIPPIDR